MKDMPQTKKPMGSGFRVWPLFLSWTFQAATEGLSGSSSKGLFWRIGQWTGVIGIGDVGPVACPYRMVAVSDES